MGHSTCASKPDPQPSKEYDYRDLKRAYFSGWWAAIRFVIQLAFVAGAIVWLVFLLLGY